MINKIFLDLDGVVRNWTGGINKLFGTNIADEEITCWDYITNRICAEKCISVKDFWEKQDRDFWINLEFTKDGQEILDTVAKVKAPVFILTSPTLNNAGWSQEWIKLHMPAFFQKKMYLIGPAKYACATPTSVLIDDAEKNIDPWRECGGIGVLYPRPWNRKRAASKNATLILKENLNYFKSKS